MILNHIMCTLKILRDLCSAKRKIKTKNGFARAVCNVLVVKMCWQRGDCLSINGVQSLKVEKRTI